MDVQNMDFPEASFDAAVATLRKEADKMHTGEKDAMSYYFSKTVQGPFPEVVAKVKDELINVDFKILTEIDVKEALKKTECGF